MKSHPTESRPGRQSRSVADNLIWPGAHTETIRRATHYLRIDDIAHALANICCLEPQTPMFYSVAQHNYLVSMLVPPNDALAALLLRADNTLEHVLPEYLEIEGHSGTEVLTRFGVPLELPVTVKCADLVLRATEQRDLGPLRDDAATAPTDVQPLSSKIHPLPLRIQPLPPIVAKHLFLDRYYELRPEADIERLRSLSAGRRAAK